MGFLSVTWQFLVPPWAGGKTIGQLSNTAGIYMPRVRNDISYGLALSQSSGKTYSPEAVMWIQEKQIKVTGQLKMHILIIMTGWFLKLMSMHLKSWVKKGIAVVYVSI